MSGPAQQTPGVRQAGNALLVGFRVSPSSSRTALRGVYGDRIKVALSAPAEDGRANAQLVESLSRWLGVMQDTIHIKAGHASRDKVVAFEGISEPELLAKFARLLG